MAKENVFPVYLIAGFLDSGKTSFINGILSDGFALEDRTMLLCCEEGEVEYDPKVLRNVTVVTAEDPETLTPEFLEAERKKCRAVQIIVEFNGMWQIQDFYVIAAAEGPTFEMYAKNMASLMMEKLRNADMILINRCTDELCAALRQKNLRLVNRRADIYLEKEDGTSEDYMDGTVSAFDLDAPEIRVSDEDYGLWYVEIMDNPRMYAGKTVIFFAMVCCAEDMLFLAVACIGFDVSGIPERTWVEIRAEARVEHWDPYEGDGPVLHVQSVTPCEKPREEVVQM